MEFCQWPSFVPRVLGSRTTAAVASTINSYSVDLVPSIGESAPTAALGYVGPMAARHGTPKVPRGSGAVVDDCVEKRQHDVPRGVKWHDLAGRAEFQQQLHRKERLVRLHNPTTNPTYLFAGATQSCSGPTQQPYRPQLQQIVAPPGLPHPQGKQH